MILNKCSISIFTENIKKPSVFWCFYDYRSGALVKNGLKMHSRENDYGLMIIDVFKGGMIIDL